MDGKVVFGGELVVYVQPVVVHTHLVLEAFTGACMLIYKLVYL